MRDEAHVGLVDAHAERDRGDHDHAFLAQEPLLILVARGRVRARRDQGNASKPCSFSHRRSLDFPARQAIHDARVVGMLGFEERLQLLPRIILLRDVVADVRPVKLETNSARLFQRQPLDDLAPRRRIRRGSQRDARHIGERA